MKKGTFFITTGLLLIAAALCLTGFNLVTSYCAEKASSTVLEHLAPQISIAPVNSAPAHRVESPDEIEYPDYILNPNMEMPIKEIDGNDYIGVLNIPALELSLPIMSDWSYPQLKISPCRYQGTPYLDNFVILAHNYARHFGLIKDLSIGDAIHFTDIDGNQFNYKVIEVIILQPTAIEEMISGDDWDLTLFTCTIGGATRVTVRCEKTEL